jgi:hypothetical protein
MIALLVTLSFALSACTLRIGTPTFYSEETHTQYYSYHSYYLGGTTYPVFTILSPYYQYTLK